MTVSASRVTIAVLNYNYERYLAEAIDSALAQDHDDVEVVVVDDGSTDGSARIIESYGDRVVAHFKANGGQASAMNAAFAVATGDLVIFLDADDLLAPDAARVVLEAHRWSPDVAWLMFRLRIIDGQGRPTERVRPRRAGVMPDGDLRTHLARYRCFHWQPTSGNAFAASALRRVMPIPEQDYRISADAYLAGVVALSGPIRSLDVVAGSYRLHGASNYSASAVDADWFRAQLQRQVVTHGHAVEVATRLGMALPEDPRAPLDVAFLSFCLASLVLDPAGHPFPDDRRVRLVGRGLAAALGNPQLAWPTRLRRAAWLLACGCTPSAWAHHVARRAPDTPAGRQRFLAGHEGQ